ncbi:putative bifunctional diguanylate cyclase/phosphodiesterase [Thiohalophilus sp.]|uniref:putative bifunctional diguanylate cyclase/phosphodiesterase n=1 Tax=Thiohalophilus sp. TaxID=3028392 RepID=UPI0039759D4A
MKHHNSKFIAYLQGIGLAIIVIAPFALIQNLVVVGEFRIQYIVIPVIVALVLGSLIGTVAWLRRDLEEQGKLFKAVADFALECSYIQSPDGRFRYISPAVKRLTGYSASDMMAEPSLLDRIVHPDDAALWAEQRARLWKTGELEVIEFRFITADGDMRWARHYAGPVIDEDGKMVSVRATTIDITRQKDYENHVRMLADYDPLTELPNRRHLQRELDGILRRAEQQNCEFCVIFMDLDRFKYINDAHGHSVGDFLLIKLAQRLRISCKPDVLLSRFGGDEFVFILPLGSTREDAEMAARKLLSLADEPFIHEGMRFTVGASFGIASYPADGINAESLIKNADAAMYQAKRVSQDIRFFSQEMGEHAAAAVQWETLLREAISRNEIEVQYQPIVNLDTGRVEAVEALARWNQPDGSQVSPMTFIPLAEEIGLIHRLDAQVAEKACAQLHVWREAGHDIKVSVNVSARRFLQADFCEDMFRIIHEAGLRPQDIKVELTESTLIEDLDNSRTKIAMLRQTGVEVAIDDFGTGFSSLGYLTSLPMDILKMDRSFIRAMTLGKRHRAVVAGVLGLAGSLEMTVVAEGIENAEQQRMLTDMGCEAGQGYFFARPMTVADTGNYLSEQRRETSG